MSTRTSRTKKMKTISKSQNQRLLLCRKIHFMIALIEIRVELQWRNQQQRKIILAEEAVREKISLLLKKKKKEKKNMISAPKISLREMTNQRAETKKSEQLDKHSETSENVQDKSNKRERYESKGEKQERSEELLIQGKYVMVKQTGQLLGKGRLVREARKAGKRTW